MIRPVHAMMQIVRYLPPSSSGELVGSHSQEAVAGTVTCWASKSWLVVQFPGLEKLLISECGNASVGKKKVEKLRLIQGISNSKRKSVYRGIILKSQEELVNVRVFNDSWNANNTPAYSLVQTQSLMLWTVLINGILSHEETDMRPFRLPMLSPNPFRRDLNVALWWLIAGFVANQLTEFWDFLLPDLHVVDLTRWQHLSQLGYHRIIHTEYESGMIRYDSTLRFPPLPYWWIRDHAIRLCQGQCLQCVPQVRQNRRAKFPSLRMYEWLQVDIEFNWAKNIKNSPHLGTSLRCQQWPCRVQVPRNKDVWRVTSRHLSAFQAFHLHRVKKSSQPKENLRTKQSQKQKISTDTNPPCPTLTQKVGGKLEPLVPSKLEMLEARWIPRWPEEHLELQSKWCKQRVMSCAAICTEWWDSSNRFYVFFKFFGELVERIFRKSLWLLCDSLWLTMPGVVGSAGMLPPATRENRHILEGEHLAPKTAEYVFQRRLPLWDLYLTGSIVLWTSLNWWVGTVITVIISPFLAGPCQELASDTNDTRSITSKIKGTTLSESEGLRIPWLSRLSPSSPPSPGVPSIPSAPSVPLVPSVPCFLCHLLRLVQDAADSYPKGP